MSGWTELRQHKKEKGFDICAQLLNTKQTSQRNDPAIDNDRKKRVIAGIGLIKKTEKTIMTLKWFFLVSFARDASLSPVLSDITKHRGIHNEECKSNTDAKMEELRRGHSGYSNALNYSHREPPLNCSLTPLTQPTFLFGHGLRANLKTTYIRLQYETARYNNSKQADSICLCLWPPLRPCL